MNNGERVMLMWLSDGVMRRFELYNSSFCKELHQKGLVRLLRINGELYVQITDAGRAVQ